MTDARLFRRPRLNMLLVLFLGLATASAWLSVVYLPTPLVDRMMREDISHEAENWRTRVLYALEGGSLTFERGQLTAADAEWLDEVTTLSDIYRFKLFTADGRVFWSSRPSDVGTVNEKPYFQDVVARGRKYYKAEMKPMEEVDSHLHTEHDHHLPGETLCVAEIYTPVMHDGRFVGAIEFYTDITEMGHIFTERLRNIFLALSSISLLLLLLTSVVIRHAGRTQVRMLRQRALKEREMMDDQMRLAREVRLLGELNEWLQSSRSLGELFEMVGRFMSHILPDCEGSVYVYSNSRDVLMGAASWNGGHHCDHIRAEDCWGLRRGRTYSFGASEVDFPCGHSEAQDDRPSFCFPVLAHGETVGLLHLKARPGLGVEDFRASQKLAQMCAEQISLAIANVQMRDQLHDRSIRDPLTGLYNRRHLTDTLRRLLERSGREDRPLSILSIDVDHFKRFNDTHGHDAGDMVLRAVGKVLEQACDGDETACRMGGEEFMLLLPDLGPEAAALRAEALRHAVEHISVRYGEKTLPRVTVSIGLAMHPDDGAMPQQLMKAADDALYDAKARGRNQVAIAGEETAGADATAPPQEPVQIGKAS
ncbi:sensor domain-containing diguanylate cyclase [Limimaricola hongkongensis]|uniref:diguanylate cyclase n=1 Tax=Limimaricola hongkongensis DSM 17492 TaxID=1122180 RepID=A0A017HA32_9RHOB|nr:diguanylate cyclase [Limimaricola hongkongensis]EYD70998.1 diguanylate cyclase, putative [Limimaricola hongkongensis DSM 17492]